MASYNFFSVYNNVYSQLSLCIQGVSSLILRIAENKKNDNLRSTQNAIYVESKKSFKEKHVGCAC